MGNINLGRWILGGLAAGIFIFIFEGAASTLYMQDMTRAMESHGLSMEMSASVWIISILVSFLAGLVAVFFYAAARPRFGPGPRTAIIVAVALFVGGYLLSLLGYYLMGLFPTKLLVIWGTTGLAEMILATLLGAWLYREA